MSVNPDFRDLFAALNAARAKFLIVGGYALAVHGAPRFTKDLDIWIKANADNGQRCMGGAGQIWSSIWRSDRSRPFEPKVLCFKWACRRIVLTLSQR